MEVSNITYRPATPEDVEGILEVVRVGWPTGTPKAMEERHGMIGGKPWQDYQIGAVRSSVETHLDTCLVAEVDGRIAGWGVWTVDKSRCVGSIAYNAVHPDFRGQGAGTGIVERCLEKLREAGMRIAIAGTGLGEEHAPACHVYEEVGFRPLRKSVQYSMEL